MAKRKRLSAPDADELAKLDASFAAKPFGSPHAMVAPIAQVAAETARNVQPGTPVERETRARDETDAARWRSAREAGRVLMDLPLEEIRIDHLSRDRISMSPEEMDELRLSLRKEGQRHPIEVVPLPEAEIRNGAAYGLISGARRLTALRALHAESGEPRFSTVRALVCADRDAAGAYTAMVVENEIRAQLTPYERGRIAVVATGQGAFGSVEEAVDVVFAAASKAKRSKIRSFAAVHETLGDLLQFPTVLSERNGLRLAQAIRDGFAAKLRDALEAAQEDIASAGDEWKVLHGAMTGAEATAPVARVSRGGRPARQVGQRIGEEIHLANGVSLSLETAETGYALRITGGTLSPDRAEAALKALAGILDAG